MRTPAISVQLELDPAPATAGWNKLLDELRRRSTEAADRIQRVWEGALRAASAALVPFESAAGVETVFARLSTLEQATDRAGEVLSPGVEESSGLKHELGDVTSSADRLGERLTQLRQQWGSMARSMADVLTNTVTSAVQGLSNALANVIVGTQSAAVAFRQFAVQMLTSFIANVLQMILMAKVAIPILTALGVLSGGSIPAAGSVATIASVGAAVAATSGYADGGVIRTGTGPRADDVLIRASRGEYVMPADKTAAYLPLLEAMRRGVVNMRDYADSIPRGLSSPTRSGYYADGGAVSGGVAGNVTVTPAPVNFAVLNSTQALRDFMEKHGAAMAFDYARKHKAQLGIRS